MNKCSKQFGCQDVAVDMQQNAFATENTLTMRFCSAFLCLLVGLEPVAASAQTIPRPQMNIVVLEGEAAINDIKARRTAPITIQVRDGNRYPIRGAEVVWTLPESGASARFPGGGRTATTKTDDQGRVRVSGLAPDDAVGAVQIRITASHGEEKAEATVTQFNMRVKAASTGGSGKKWAAILGALGAAAATGTVLALRNRSGSTPAALPPIVLTPGTGSVGAP